jgi:uncharacterized membrane protein
MKETRGYDSRKYQGKIAREVVIGYILITFVLGLALIYAIWGGGAALTGFITLLGCTFVALVVVGLIWGFLALIGWMGGREE